MQDETAVQASAPIDVPETELAQEVDQSIEATPKEAVERAFAALEDKDEENSPDSEKAETKQEPTSQDDKTANDAGDYIEAPSRFSEQAKQAFKEAPEPVRAEIHRAITELEGGIEKYKKVYEPFKGWDDALKQTGQTPDEVFQHYVGMENLLAKDPIAGMSKIAENLGTTLQDIASHVLNQPLQQQTIQQDKTIRELRDELASLKQELGGVSSTIKQQNEAKIFSEIEAFAAENPRFDELSQDIAFFIESGRTSDINEAYKLAERLNPAPSPVAPERDRKAQTLKGQKSIAGAPTAGSNPTNRKPASTANEALSRAFAQLGM